MSSAITPDRTGRAGAALSVSEVRRWLSDNRRSLSARRISASIGQRIALAGTDPLVWISMTSEWASGRFVRDGDGSSEIEAHRSRDGATLLAERHPEATAAQLEGLAVACARPQPSSADPAPAADEGAG